MVRLRADCEQRLANLHKGVDTAAQRFRVGFVLFASLGLAEKAQVRPTAFAAKDWRHVPTHRVLRFIDHRAFLLQRELRCHDFEDFARVDRHGLCQRFVSGNKKGMRASRIPMNFPRSFSEVAE